MAIKLIGKNWCPYVEDYRCEFVMDSAADAVYLPKCCAGSTAFAAEQDGPLFVVNASGEWKEV